MCGEKSTLQAENQALKGSPLRVRGKALIADIISSIFGITPACAGKSPPASQRLVFYRDHPRVCGEKARLYHVGLKCIGSPPRVRGKAFYLQHTDFVDGITPACAGKRLKKYREYANISIDYDAIHLTSHRSLKAYGNLPTHGDPASLLIRNIQILWIIYNQRYHQSISWQAAMYLYSDYAAQVFRSGDKQKPKISVQMQRYDIQSDHF